MLTIMDLFGTLKAFKWIRQDIEECYDQHPEVPTTACAELQAQQAQIEGEAERVFRELVTDIIREEAKRDGTGPV